MNNERAGDTSSRRMSVMEREQLSRAIRMREKVAKSELRARGSAALADFETQIQAVFQYDDDAVWKEAMERAKPVIEQAQQMIAARSQELGIPARFAPRLSASWFGQATVKEERSEYRRLAHSRVEAMVARGLAHIETTAAQMHVELISGALESTEARDFLARIPDANSLIPKLDLGEFRKLLIDERRDIRKRSYYRTRQEKALDEALGIEDDSEQEGES